MNTTIRNSFLALTVVGALALAACKTTDDDMTPAPAPAAEPATPMSDMAPPANDTDSMSTTDASTDTSTDTDTPTDPAPPTP